MQAIKYKWGVVGGVYRPFLFLSNEGKIKRIPVMGEKVSLKVGDRKCIGHFKGGRHRSCPNGIALKDEWNCNECRLADDFFMCMKCDGSECVNARQRPTCEQEKYFVYLAAFDSILKVGISHERRIIERLIEQGADFGAKIAYVRDGKDVRTLEQEIARHLNITDKVRGAEKQKRMFGNPNASMLNISSAISNLQGNGFAPHLVRPEIYDLRPHYNLSAVPYNPESLHVRDSALIEGTVVASKGPIIVTENNHRFYSFNAHELIGRDIELN